METATNNAQAIATQGENMSILAANVGGNTASAQLATTIVEERKGCYEDVKALHETIVELTDLNASLTEKLNQATMGAEKVKLVIAQDARFGETERIVRYEATPAVLALLTPAVKEELEAKYKNALVENVQLKQDLSIQKAERIAAVKVAKTELQQEHMIDIAELNREHAASIENLENRISERDITISGLKREIARLQDDKDYANLEKENLKLRETITKLSKKLINWSAIRAFFSLN